MKKILNFTLLLMLSSVMCFSDNDSSGWSKEFTKEGITVYTRAVEGINLKEFKGIGIIEATMEDIFTVLSEPATYTKWMADCTDAKKIKQIDENQMIVFQETSAPWPVSNRDVVVLTRAFKEKDRILSTIDAVKDSDFPAKKGNVRMTDLKGKWILERQGEFTLATYQIRANPGGMLPDWVANMASKDLPYVTIKKLRLMVKK